jgi:hypothetical protein
MHRSQNGWYGDYKSVYPYRGYYSQAIPTKRDIFDNVYTVGAGQTESLIEFYNEGGRPSWAIPTANKAYERFRQKALGDASQLGTFVAEWRESLGMVTNRAIGLRKAYSALRKGKFRQALKHLSVAPKKKHRNKVSNAAHEASGLWLEYWFGWAPSLADMYTALEQLSDPLPLARFHGSARTLHQDDYFYAPWGIARQSSRAYWARTGASISVSNPNLFLASQLGVVNPVSVLWEVIPFSFLVDWVFKVGNFIESFTDFVGCSLDKPYSTYFMKYYDNHQIGAYLGQPYSEWASTYVTGVVQIRVPGIIRPVPDYHVFANLGTSITRTATAVSLLAQVLNGFDVSDLHRI